MLVAFLMSLSLLTGCGSSSSTTVVYDSGIATGSEEVAVDPDTGETTAAVTVVAVDDTSKRETTTATIPAGTTMLDAEGAPILESVEVKVSAKSEDFAIPEEVAVGENESTTGTVIDVSALTKSGTIVAEIDQEIEVTVAAPELTENSTQEVTEAWMLIEDVATAASLRSTTRGVLVKLTIKADGSVDLSFEYIPGRIIKIIWIFEEVQTGAVGGN